MGAAVTCHYMRATVHELTVQKGHSIERYERMVQLFADIRENFTKQHFYNVAERLLKTMKRGWNGGATARASFLEKFQTKTWSKLELSEKAKHTAAACQVCATEIDHHRAYPAKVNHLMPLLEAAQNATYKTTNIVALQE